MCLQLIMGVSRVGQILTFLVIAVSHLFSQMNIDKISESWLTSSLSALKHLVKSAVKHQKE